MSAALDSLQMTNLNALAGQVSKEMYIKAFNLLDGLQCHSKCLREVDQKLYNVKTDDLSL